MPFLQLLNFSEGCIPAEELKFVMKHLPGKVGDVNYLSAELTMKNNIEIGKNKIAELIKVAESEPHHFGRAALNLISNTDGLLNKNVTKCDRFLLFPFIFTV
jgi:hypothetical protein